MPLNKIPLEIFEGALKYKLIKLDDAGNPMFWWLGYHAVWIRFKEGEYESHREVRHPKPGYSLTLDYDGTSFKWQTSEITELTLISLDKIEFKTTGSHYRLCILS